MTAPADLTAAWSDEGRRVAGALDAVGSALVIGRDPEAAALVALGIARAQAARRRVAVADLIGEVGPLQSLVQGDDPHGIADSFLYGVSLNKIARPADASGNLFILPSGSEPVAVEEIFRSDRWRRLAIGFREVDALLLLVAHADTPGLDSLASSVDGVIAAGDATGALPDAAPPLAVVATPRQRRAAPAPPRAATPAAAEPETSTVQVAPPGPRPWRRWLTIAMLALIVATALAYWLLPRTISRQGELRPTAADSAALDSARADSVRGDSVARAAAQDSARQASAPLPALAVANPGDSANVAAFSVWVGSASSPEGAAEDLRGSAQQAPPVIALTPVLEDGTTWYRLIVGAYPRREQADSLLAELRRRGVVGEQSGNVVRTPYALLVADRVPASEVEARVRALTAKNVPVYPLSRGDGTVALYSGAFQMPQDAAWLARQLRSAGVTPTLVYRTGRSL